MTKVLSILEFVAQTRAIDRDLEQLFGTNGHDSAIVAKACQLVQKKAKAAIGQEHGRVDNRG
jgi:hypothetical protein